jgi:exodeoxyribonuclease-3
MRITSWNVNSVRARLHRIPEWLDEARPDVLCLQELKCQEDQFPREVFESRGYHLAIRGQKTYNGVAIASLLPMEDVDIDLPLAGDAEARGIAATIDGIRVVNLYVVNGKAVGDVKYEWKLRWLDALIEYVKGRYEPSQDLVICGDYNIAPTDEDTWDPEYWHDRVLCSVPERERLQALLDWGLHDSYRELYPDSWGRYAHTWWDYRGFGFQRGNGMRIDHHLVTRSIMNRATGVEIDRDARKGEKPSDHAPVTLVIDPN